MSKLIIRERQIEDISVLDLEGKIMLGEGTQELRNTIRTHIEKSRKNILLNLENLSTIDSSGLGELVAAYTSITKSNGQIKLLNLSKRVHELMFITKLLTVFDVYDNEAEAINDFNANSSKIEKQLPKVERVEV
jgi:anti-sigma B factor antagonist